MGMILRRAKIEDKARVLLVEQKSTKNLRYLTSVFEHWVHDRVGELSVVELDDVLVGVGKLTVLPDGSAWLEALRVSGEAQGKGVGKRFYQRFFEIANAQGIKTMRMYTGVENFTSKGLAERYGFHLDSTYFGSSRPVDLTGTADAKVSGFELVTDGDRACELLLPLANTWPALLVMNRTFHKLTPELCHAWANESKIYYDASSQSVIILGARFQGDLALHIAFMHGDLAKCLSFAEQQARFLAVPQLQCLFPVEAEQIKQALLFGGYKLDNGRYIVEEVNIDL